MCLKRNKEAKENEFETKGATPKIWRRGLWFKSKNVTNPWRIIKDYHKPKSSIRRGKKDKRCGENPA